MTGEGFANGVKSYFATGVIVALAGVSPLTLRHTDVCECHGARLSVRPAATAYCVSPAVSWMPSFSMRL